MFIQTCLIAILITFNIPIIVILDESLKIFKLIKPGRIYLFCQIWLGFYNHIRENARLKNR
jgi:hypothetical protein